MTLYAGKCVFICRLRLTEGALMTMIFLNSGEILLNHLKPSYYYYHHNQMNDSLIQFRESIED